MARLDTESNGTRTLSENVQLRETAVNRCKTSSKGGIVNENQFQYRLVEECKAEGGHGLRMRHRNRGGIADLYLRLGQAFWVECKYDTNKPRNGPTLLQAEFINAELDAGGYAGWMVCVLISFQTWEVYVGIDENEGVCLGTRKRGQRWFLQEALQEIVRKSAFGERCHGKTRIQIVDDRR